MEDNFPNTFKDKVLEKELSTHGYVLLKNAVSPLDIQALKSFCKKTILKNDWSNYAATEVIADPKVRCAMIDFVMSIFRNFIDTFFVNHKIVTGHFIIKRPDENNEVTIHQDLSFLDETRYRPINVWAPLIDVDYRNGALEVLNGSHKLSNPYRGFSLPTPYSRVFPEFSIFCETSELPRSFHQRIVGDILVKKFISIPMKKGDLLVFDTSLIHRSPPLQNDALRVAAAGLVAPVNADLKYYYSKVLGVVEEYNIDETFFF